MSSITIGQLEADLADAVQRRDDAGQLVALRGLAEIYAGRGDAEQALAYQYQAIDMARQLDADSILGELLYNAGTWRLSLNQPAAALPLLIEALDLARATGIDENVLSTVSVLAQAQAMTAPKDAIPLYEEARDLARRMDDPAHELHALQGLAWIGQQLGQKGMILDNLTRALAIVEGAGDPGLAAPVHMSIGLTHAADEDFANAAACFEQAVEAYRAAGDGAQAARALGNLGTAYGRESRFDAARDALQQAADLFAELGMAQDAHRAQMMADTITQSGKLP